MLELAIVWGFLGLAFWWALIVYNGFPNRWKSNSRYAGWDDYIQIWLPLSIIGGPVWWLVFGAVRYMYYLNEEKN